jgi:hypothetical protein
LLKQSPNLIDFEMIPIKLEAQFYYFFITIFFFAVYTHPCEIVSDCWLVGHLGTVFLNSNMLTNMRRLVVWCGWDKLHTSKIYLMDTLHSKGIHHLMPINYKYNSLHHAKCIYSCFLLHCTHHCAGRLQFFYMTCFVASGHTQAFFFEKVIHKPILIYLKDMMVRMFLSERMVQFKSPCFSNGEEEGGI